MLSTARLNQKLDTRRAIANIGCQPVMLDIHDIAPHGCNGIKQTCEPAGLILDRSKDVEIAPLPNHPALNNVSQQLEVHIAATKQTNRTSLAKAFVLKKCCQTCRAAWFNKHLHPRQ